jgi:hypothetical protein
VGPIAIMILVKVTLFFIANQPPTNDDGSLTLKTEEWGVFRRRDSRGGALGAFIRNVVNARRKREGAKGSSAPTSQ